MTNTFIGKTFTDEVLDVDGRSFQDCTFNNCQLVYSGGDHVNISGCDLTDSTFGFDGAAARTLVFLHAMNNGGFKAVVHPTIVALNSPDPLRITPRRK